MGGLEQPGLDEKMAAILAICQKMNSERDLGALLDLLAREATDLLDCERASIFILDPERSELWSKVALGSDEILRIQAGKGIVGRAVETGEIINVKDAYSHPQFYTAIDDQTGYRTRNLLACPMGNGQGRTIGAFEVLNKRVGAFGPRDEAALAALASHAAIAIENAQLIGQLRRSQDELEEQNATLLREIENRFTTHGIIGAGLRVQQIVRLVDRIRDSLVNVLITGESGTGKEMVAKAIHYTSPRARRPFVALNCAALTESLVESELFGIEKGVATGVEARIGLFERASSGTLFLDEIGDLSLTAQAKILRVLQERVMERVGGRTPIPVDVRLLSATNKDLETEIGRGAFRQDLYYRIKVVHIGMPPLRDIREEIPLLATHFLKEYCKEAGRPQMEFAASVMRRLVRSDWPGNVRQLRNEVMRLAAISHGNLITDDDAWDAMPAPPRYDAPVTPRPVAASLKHAVEALEKQMIAEALASNRNNQQQTAKLLGLSRQGLINKMKRYSIAG